MKILSLDLMAYGPFAGTRLDLSAGAEGLHVIFGRNEAGKSSALRALDAFLFGIAPQTADAFRHPYDSLRIGGCLRLAAGQELRLIRRKGRKNTLRSDDDATIVDDAELERALGGVSRETFRLMFGIDHEALVRGGQDILEQRGDVGQALFGTSLGAAGLHHVLKELDGEARELFLPGGSKPKINQALREFKEASRRIKEHTLKTSRWVEADRLLREAESDLAQVADDLRKVRALQNGWKRVKGILPIVGRRRDLLDQLEATGTRVDLPDDFASRWESATAERREAEKSLKQREPQLVALENEIASFQIPQQVLDQEETIEAFHQGLGSYRKAAQDLPARRTEQALAQAEAKRLLATVRGDLDVDAAEGLRPVLGRASQIQDLSTEYSLLVQRVEDARSDLCSETEAVTNIRTELAQRAQQRDLGRLQRAVDEAKRAGQVDDEVLARERTLGGLRDTLGRKLATLGLWEGDIDALAATPLPQPATVERFERIVADLDQRLSRNRDKREAAAEEETRLTGELEAIAGAGAVPTEVDLAGLRAQRDAGWALVRAQWLEGKDVQAAVGAYAPDGDLATAYEMRVAEADEVADRLRREANRVQQKAAATAGLQGVQRRRETLKEERGEIEAARHEVEAQWVSAWSAVGITPLSPAEMRSWLTRAEQIIETAQGLPTARADGDAACQRRDELRAALLAALTGFGADPDATGERLQPLLVQAEALGAQIAEANAARGELEKRLATAEDGVASAADRVQAGEAALVDWRKRWQPLVKELGLAADARPSDCVEMVERIRELFRSLDSAAGLAVRIRSMTEDQEQFERELKGFCQTAVPDLVELPVAEGVAQLNARLKKARDADARREERTKRRDSLVDEVREAKGHLSSALEELNTMMTEAGCHKEEETIRLVERKGLQQELQEQVDTLEEQLLELGEGLRLDQLLEEAEQVDADELVGTLQHLETEAAELEERQRACVEARTRSQADLEQMDGGGAAAAAAMEAQEQLALMGTWVEDYVRARLAQRVLKDEIQRYREENEGPLLGRASEIFHRLCLGSFAALRVDYRDDSAVLVGERAGGSRIPVEGMSSGTRDQLYLALRLAGVERAIEKSEPLPFIVDDILVNFDDERSKATLEVFEELAQKTQVVLFSHHNRVADLAKQLTGSAGVFVHEGWNRETG